MNVASILLLVLLWAPMVRAEPRVVVEPPEALVDAPPRIRLDAFPPRQPITVAANLDIAGVGAWQSRAVFRSDGAGRVDMASDAPESAMTHPVTGGRYALGGTARGNADAAADSWPKVLEFFERARVSRP